MNHLNSKWIFAITGYENETAGGVKASSTGNKSGIFDLSGCVWERTAGYISNGESYIDETSNPNGYKTLSTKYITVYPYDSTNDSKETNWTKYNSLKGEIYGYGDAILETSITGEGFTSWNDDFSKFPYKYFTFFERCGNCRDGSDAGIFTFDNTSGGAYCSNGFRVVLVCDI